MPPLRRARRGAASFAKASEATATPPCKAAPGIPWNRVQQAPRLHVSHLSRTPAPGASKGEGRASPLFQRKLHHHGPVIGQIAPHHLAVEHATVRGEENEIERAPWPRGRERADALRRMERVVTLQGEVLKQRSRGIKPMRGVVQIAAKNGPGGPL